jgi:hypothetical protein
MGERSEWGTDGQRRCFAVEGVAARDKDGGRWVAVATGDDERWLLWCEAGRALAPVTWEFGFGIWSRRVRKSQERSCRI